MDLFLVIAQGTGLALACGLGPFPAALAAGLLALADLGVDFEGSGYGFLESPLFLVAMALLSIAWIVASRARGGGGRTATRRDALVATAIAAVVLGALLFAGSLGDEGYEQAPGLAAGALVAALGALVAGAVVLGASTRLAGHGEAGTASFLAVFTAAAALALAALAIALPPLSFVALALCAWLLVQRRRRAGEKYEGLRVLR
jgi:Domain of unknown function (DUF4126)